MNPTLWPKRVGKAVETITSFMVRDEKGERSQGQEIKGMVEQDLVSIVRRHGFEK